MTEAIILHAMTELGQAEIAEPCVCTAVHRGHDLKVTPQLSARGLAGVYVLLCSYPSSRAVLKKATGSSLVNTALLNMYYPTSIFI